MSEKEFSRLGVSIDLEAGRLRGDDAAQLRQFRRRQAFWLLIGLRTEGSTGAAFVCAQAASERGCSLLLYNPRAFLLRTVAALSRHGFP